MKKALSIIPALLLTLLATASQAQVVTDLPIIENNQTVPASNLKRIKTQKTHAMADESMSSPLVVRIVEASQWGYDNMVLSDSNKVPRISISTRGIVYYRNSKNIQIGSAIIDGIDNVGFYYIQGQAEEIYAGCPLDITLDRTSLKILNVRIPFCKKAPSRVVNLVSSRTIEDNVYLYDSRNNVPLSFSTTRGNYGMSLNSKVTAYAMLSGDAMKALNYSVRGVTPQCPIRLEVNSANGRIRKVTASCDVLE
ncbi:MAG TPA: hypothetical protein VF412_16735 [Bdellovibrio sp.]|uniref:hypothetical protein n=1 Tax=Bdellovibrio sp. TaxID=28201 RepID=UPI002EF25218